MLLYKAIQQLGILSKVLTWLKGTWNGIKIDWKIPNFVMVQQNNNDR